MVKLLDITRPSHGLWGPLLLLFHSVLEQSFPLFTKDPAFSQVSVVGESNPPDSLGNIHLFCVLSLGFIQPCLTRAAHAAPR